MLVACSPLNDDQRYIVSFLAERGAEVNGESFTCQHRGDGIKLYNSPNGQFVLLADTVYSRTLQGQRVLAFSTTNGWGTGISMRKFFTYYEQTLRLAYYQHIQITASDFQERIAPLLSFSWGQKAPYNAECPDNVLPAGALSWEPNIVSTVVCHIRLMNTPYTERTVHPANAGTLGEVLQVGIRPPSRLYYRARQRRTLLGALHPYRHQRPQSVGGV